MRGRDREPRALRAGIDTRGLHRAGRHGEREASCLLEQPELGRREALRIQVREGVALDRGSEVEEGGVAHAGQGQGRAQVGIGLDALFCRDLVGPAGRHDLAQQRQRPLDLELLVQRLRLAQQVGGLGLRACLGGRCYDQRQA